MTEPKRYRATVEFLAYETPPGMPGPEERIRRCLETHPSLSMRIEDLQLEELHPIDEAKTCPTCGAPKLALEATQIACMGCGAEWGRVNGTWVQVQERCPGEGRCHGCLNWCVVCGEVGRVCDFPECDVHWIVHHPDVHYLRGGHAICADDTGLEGAPAEWPEGHSWSEEPEKLTCDVCQDIYREDIAPEKEATDGV